MTTTIYKKMIDFMNSNRAKHAWMTANEWTAQLDIVITPQRMTAMYKSGLIDRVQDKQYYGDTKYRYEPIKKN